VNSKLDHERRKNGLEADLVKKNNAKPAFFNQPFALRIRLPNWAEMGR
jgi:hypothetical protein